MAPTNDAKILSGAVAATPAEKLAAARRSGNLNKVIGAMFEEAGVNQSSRPGAASQKQKVNRDEWVANARQKYEAMSQDAQAAFREVVLGSDDDSAVSDDEAEYVWEAEQEQNAWDEEQSFSAIHAQIREELEHESA